MKINIFNSSPRKNGNCAFIKEKITSKYINENTIKEYHLNDLNYKGCQACYSCKNNNSFCVVKDDLYDMLPALIETDLIVLLTPNYYNHCSGQHKLFLDRWFCLSDKKRYSKFSAGTKLFFIVTQGSPNSQYSQGLVDWMKSFALNYQLKFYGLIIPNCNTNNTDGASLKINDILLHLNMFF
jgi:multimeric flavodoxin WrbA